MAAGEVAVSAGQQVGKPTLHIYIVISLILWCFFGKSQIWQQTGSRMRRPARARRDAGLQGNKGPNTGEMQTVLAIAGDIK